MWSVAQPAWASHRAARTISLSLCLGLSTSKVRSASGISLALLPGQLAAVPICSCRRDRCSHPGVAELRGNRTNELNCTPTPLTVDYGKRNKGEAGLHLLALSLQSPTEFAPSEVSSGCPPAAQRSPTPSFLFSTACQETCYSAPNMWLARGQGLAADRLTNYLARVMASPP